MYRFFVIDTPKSGTGTEFIADYDTLEQANKQAAIDWHHLTKSEKENRHIYVAKVNYNDFMTGTYDLFIDESMFDSL